MQKLLLFFLLFSFVTLKADEPRCLDYETARQRALAKSLVLLNAQIERSVAEGNTLQAGLRPNPEFQLDAEDISGNEQQFSYTVAQLFELGGKRQARVSVAESLEDVAQWNQIVLQNELQEKFALLFLEAFLQQEMAAVAQREKEADEKVLETVKAKVESGKVPLSHQYRAEIALSKSQHNLEHSQRECLHAKLLLAALWGDSCLDFDCLTFPFYEIAQPMPLCDLMLILFCNPYLSKLESEITAAEENLNLQQKLSTPDVEVFVGFDQEKRRNKSGVEVGFVVPIPIFDRNQGNIAASQAEVCLAENKRKALQLELEAALSAAYQKWLCSYHAAVSMRDTVLKNAQNAYNHIEEGYQLGKFELLDLLDARQMLDRLNKEYIEILSEYHIHRAIVEKIIGKNLNEGNLCKN